MLQSPSAVHTVVYIKVPNVFVVRHIAEKSGLRKRDVVAILQKRRTVDITFAGAVQNDVMRLAFGGIRIEQIVAHGDRVIGKRVVIRGSPPTGLLIQSVDSAPSVRQIDSQFARFG